MRVCIIGRQGQLARAILERGADRPGLQILPIGRPELELELSESIEQAIRLAAPDVVINAAAYTAVDQAEDEPSRAWRINADAAGDIASAAKGVGAPIIHISTDYVFDGSAKGSYHEDAPTSPLGVYGASKLCGEEQVREAHPDHLIVRTAWVFSPFGRNFVRTMLRLANEHDEVSVVADQHGSPTSALDLADGLLQVLEMWRRNGLDGMGEIYHLAGRGKGSWAEVAEEIFRISDSLGGPIAAVRRIQTGQFPTKASRPRNSELDSSKFERRFGFAMSEWEVSLVPVIQRLMRLEGFCNQEGSTQSE